jgi:hypothetical protein
MTTDFSNVIKEKSYLRPSNTHLDFFVSLKKINKVRYLFDSLWTYQVKIFCSVPILVFRCPQQGCSILIHLNIHLLEGTETTPWLDADKLTFMLIISDASKSNYVAGAKIIKISQGDTMLIRIACLKQRSLSCQGVENLVNNFYQMNFNNIWPGEG